MMTLQRASAGGRQSRGRNDQAHGRGYLAQPAEHVPGDSAEPAHRVAGQHERDGQPGGDSRGQQPLARRRVEQQAAERGKAERHGGEDGGYRCWQRPSDERAEPAAPGGGDGATARPGDRSRPATVAATSAAGPWAAGLEVPRACAWASAATWTNRVSTSVATPNGPISERFIISRASGAALPLPRPSARSARPSRCRPRVSSARAATASTAASSGPARSRRSAPTRTAAAAAPSARPTAGAQAIAAAAVCLLMLPAVPAVPAATP